MFTRALIRFACSSSLVVSGLPAAAAAFFPNGQCALVVASRPSVEEARTYILENGWANLASVYLSDNGWYAIAVDMVNTDKAAAVLNSRKAAGYYPSDAYCSTGQKYVREVAWQASTGAPLASTENLWSDFDARPLSLGDKRFLQAALALEGYYNGLLDGAWGRGSQDAFERHAMETFDIDKPANAHAAWLAVSAMRRISEEGWELKNVGYLGISMFMPSAHMRLTEEDGTQEIWEHETKDLAVLFDDLDLSGLASAHERLASEPKRIGQPYEVRGEDTWVTSVGTSDGSLYARSDKIQGTWSTVLIAAGYDAKSDIALISSSIRRGPPSEMFPTENGVLMTYVSQFLDVLSEEDSEAPETGMVSSTPPSVPDEQGGFTGTAFFINGDGIALTNAHVVEECGTVTLDGKPAEILNVSAAFDLAALKLMVPAETEWLPFAKHDAGLNADITIAGYPLHGLLGGLNVSRGSVSSMKGLAGDETSIQISAPVQPGNSGGPAINSSGGVVGVVVSKLNALALAGETGDIAQNVNFAIRGTLAKVFLASNGIAYTEIENGAYLAPEDAAKRLQATTLLVECQ